MATIGDVAREAGVSRSTVSSVLTGNKYVAPHTRVRIENAIKKLDFTVNSVARTLATARTMRLGLLLNVDETQYISTASLYVVSIAEHARRLGYRLTLLTGGDGVSEIEDALSSKSVDGLLLMEVLEDDPRMEPIRSGNVPACLIGMPTDSSGVDAIDFDYVAAGRLAVDRLYVQGARKVAFICWPESLYEAGPTYACRTQRGIRERSKELGITLNAFHCDSQPGPVHRTLEEIIKDPTYTGLLFHNDAAAPMVAELLHRHSRHDVAVTGLCSARVAREHWLPFTTIDTRPEQSTAAAVDILVGRLNGETGPNTRILLEPTLNAAVDRNK